MRRLLETYFEESTGKTFVRHPHREGEWVECCLLPEARQDRPMTSVSSFETFEILDIAPNSEGAKPSVSKQVHIKLTMEGTCHKRRHDLE
jgi:hypothetical protein